MREVAAELEKPGAAVQGGKDSIVLSRLAEKAFAPGVVPFAVMHVDTGHNFPEVIEYRDRAVAELGLELIVASRAGVDRQRPRDRRDRPARLAQPAADGHAARRDRRARLRRRLRRRPPRRGALAREGARAVVPRRLRPVGSAPPAAGAVGPLQRPRAPRRARARVPALQLDRARRLAVHRRRAARVARRSTSPTSARSSSATGCSTRSPSTSSCIDGEESFIESVRYRTVGDMSSPARCARPRRRSRTSWPRSPRRGSPSAARRAPTTASSEAAMEDRKREGYF